MTRREFYALFGVLFLLVSIALVGMTVQIENNRARARENRELAIRVATQKADVLARQQRQIQQSRVASCQAQYRSFREILGPFARPSKAQTPKEKAQIRRFNAIIAKKVAGCFKQTRPGNKPTPPAP
jgi:hypothetical protein